MVVVLPMPEKLFKQCCVCSSDLVAVVLERVLRMPCIWDFMDKASESIYETHGFIRVLRSGKSICKPR